MILYRQIESSQSGHALTARGARVRALTRGGVCPLPAENSDPLGIFTKSPVILTNKGVQRIHEFLLQDQSAKLLPLERVCNCLKKRIDKKQQRTVKYNEDRQKALWGNVQRCGSVWTCPVCAKQITEKRRDELKTGLETWKNAHSGGVLLLTLTFSHSANESLKSLLQRQNTHIKDFMKILGSSI
jgi:hypothetical protein